MIHIKHILPGLLLALSLPLAGCGLFGFIDRGEGYETSEPAPPLEVPPDLDQPTRDPSMEVPDILAETGAPVGEAPLPPDLDGTALPEAPDIELPRDDAGFPYLALEDTVESAWRRAGYALDRVGFTIHGRDEGRRIYSIEYIPPAERNEGGGFFSWLLGRDASAATGHHYQVSIVGAGADRTRIVVLDRAGEPDDSASAERILALLAERMNP